MSPAPPASAFFSSGFFGAASPGSGCGGAGDATGDDTFWARARASGVAADYREYLEKYPRGRHAADAQAALARLSQRAAEDQAAEAALDLSPAVRQVVDSHEDSWGIDSQEKYQEYIDSGERSVRTLQELHAAELDRDLLAERIAQVRDSGVTVAVRVSPQNARELAPVVIAAGAEILFIQGSIVSAEHVQQGGEPLNLKEFVGSLDVPVPAAMSRMTSPGWGSTAASTTSSASIRRESSPPEAPLPRGRGEASA